MVVLFVNFSKKIAEILSFSFSFQFFDPSGFFRNVEKKPKINSHALYKKQAK